MTCPLEMIAADRLNGTPDSHEAIGVVRLTQQAGDMQHRMLLGRLQPQPAVGR